MPRPLENIRVVEYGTSDSVRLTGMLLADQGAEVVRVEPGMLIPDRQSNAITDRSKYYIQVTHTSDQDSEAFNEIISNADILIEDDSTDLQLPDANTLRTVIRCSMPPSKDIKDVEQWTEGALGAISGLHETLLGIGKPRFVDLSIASVLTALHSVNAITMSLVSRQRFGIYNHIEIPVDKVALSSQIIGIMIRANPPLEWEPARMYSSPFMGVWKTRDREYIYLQIGMPRHLRSFLFLLDRSGYSKEKKLLKALIDNDTKRDPIKLNSVLNSVKIIGILKEMFRSKDALYWEELIGNAGLCCTKVRSFDEWRKHPQVSASDEIIECKLSENESLNVPGKILVSKCGIDDSINLQIKGKISSAELKELWTPRQKPEKKETNSLPLEGLKVLDLSRVIAGPYCGRLLAEYGAQVLHLSFRKGHLSWEEPFYIAFSAGKDSVAIDYSRPDGKDSIKRIIEKYKPDIVIHNFLDEAAKKIGVDYESMRMLNQEIVYVDIQGYNVKGPWGSRPGFEQNVQAASGILESYSRGSAPGIVPIPINDMSAGIIACLGVALSLVEQQSNRKGSTHYTSFLTMPSILFQYTLLNKQEDKRSRYVRYFKAKDRWFFLSIQISEIDHLKKIAELSQISTSIKSLDSQLEAIFKTKPVLWWKSRVKAAKLGKEIILIPQIRLKELLRRELRKKNDGLFAYKEHQGFGTVLVNYPPITTNTKVVRKASIAPYIGSANEKYIRNVGIDPSPFIVKIPKIEKKSFLKNKVDRIKWLVTQSKWLIPILYRTFSLKR